MKMPFAINLLISRNILKPFKTRRTYDKQNILLDIQKNNTIGNSLWASGYYTNYNI